MSREFCFHCGEPCGNAAIHSDIQGVERWFCCGGCHAVANLITGSGLQAVYENRTAYQPSLSNASSETFVWYHESLAEHSYTKTEQGVRTVDLLIEGLNCGACVWLCEQSLSALAGVESATIRFEASRLAIRYNPERTSLRQLCETIEGLGYRLKPFEKQAQEQYFKTSQHRLLTRVGVSGLGMMLIVMLALAMHLGAAQGVHSMPVALGNFMLFASTVVSGLIIAFCGWPFFAGSVSAIRQRVVSMDVTISAALLLAWGLSAANIVQSAMTTEGVIFYQQVTYYESLVMLLFFILLNRYSELRIRHKNLADLSNLQQTAALMVEKRSANGFELVCSDTLNVGEVIRLHAGQTVPVDATVIDGHAEVDESLLNGEFTPVEKQHGDKVLAGSVLQSHDLLLQITAVGSATHVSAIEALVDEAITNKPRIVSLADKFASQFLSFVVVIAFVAAIVWSLIDTSRVFDVVLAILIAACPCALAIATPSAVARASLALRQQGVLLRDADVLFRLAKIQRWVFDKTGTLTDVQPKIARIDIFDPSYSEQQLLDIAAALEAGNQHVVAKVFQANTQLSASGIEAVAGSGVEASVGGVRYRIGKPAFVQEWHPAFSPTTCSQMPVVLASQGSLLAVFWLDESLKTGAKDTLTQLAQHFELSVLSGDHRRRGIKLMSALGLPTLQSKFECSALQKQQQLRQWQTENQACAMVGDGINDAPAMAEAALSIAMNDASDLTKTRADVVLLKVDLLSLIDLLQVAARCRAVVNQGFYWSLAYNAIALTLAASGLLSPLLAVVGMVASSFLVLINAKRVGHLNRRTHQPPLPPRLQGLGVAQ